MRLLSVVGPLTRTGECVRVVSVCVREKGLSDVHCWRSMDNSKSQNEKSCRVGNKGGWQFQFIFDLKKSFCVCGKFLHIHANERPLGFSCQKVRAFRLMGLFFQVPISEGMAF